MCQVSPLLPLDRRTRDRDHIAVGCESAVGGDFMEIEHAPSGIKRLQPPPLGAPEVQRETKARFLREIEAELIAKGLTQYVANEK